MKFRDMPKVEREHCRAIRKVLQHFRGQKGDYCVIRKVSLHSGKKISVVTEKESAKKAKGGVFSKKGCANSS